MAEFCRECCVEVWGRDTGDLKDLCDESTLASVICEGCGPILVDHQGVRVERFRVIEEREGKGDALLGSYKSLAEAEHWLTHYLNHEHNAYLVDSEDNDATHK
ncbi:hypothetical protein TW86_03720 [Halomonas sp. S2151]|uniref:hypothetical protein n=1 Tax=Halomonas sp. S2151 TaxID=579478 RepID=UPI0005FA5651|nr:hypothetical protein [Halomonas sp. S2151]KJZ17375.1 hypothetical protein TW86_03720 [Halomonas sp. S2151]